MGITSSNKQISTDRIDCGETLKVTLALSAAPDISTNPTDIVLVLDRSGSMAGQPLADLKVGAKTFIEIIEEATDGTADGVIGSGSHIGIVSFAGTATADTQLITSVADLDAAVDALTAGGPTNHADAFTKAVQLFDPLSANAKVIVMFTDGKTTAGPPAAPIADAAKASGIIIYCIGLVGEDGIDVDVLNQWATDPDDSHVVVTPDSGDLEELFRDLAANISKTGATNIVIDEVVSSQFTITSMDVPTKGTAVLVDANTIQWKIPELGVMGNEGAALEFYIRHTGQDSGQFPVNQSITYSDTEGNQAVFPDPVVTVDCGSAVCPEPCPTPVDLTMESCQGCVVLDAGAVQLESQGRILQLEVTVKNVCPGKRTALAVLLSEVDEHGMEHPRGMKTYALPAHSGPGCQDILVRCIRFVLPESLDVSGSTPDAMCNDRDFRVRFLAHSIDSDFVCCCQTSITMP